MLPRYFKHNKLGSLTQQLHTYGFVRHNGEANALGQMVFSREFFRANAASELSRIRRGFPAYRPDESMRTDELPHDGVPTSAVASSTEGGTPESRLQNLQAQHSQLAQVLTALDGRFRDHKQQASYALLAIGEVLARRRPDLGSMISNILMRDDQIIGVSSPRPSCDDYEPPAPAAGLPAPAMSVRESEGAEGATEVAPHEVAKSADAVRVTRHLGGGSDRASGSESPDESPDQEGEGSDERSDSAGRSSDMSQESGSAAGPSSGPYPSVGIDPEFMMSFDGEEGRYEEGMDESTHNGLMSIYSIEKVCLRDDVAEESPHMHHASLTLPSRSPLIATVCADAHRQDGF